MERIHSVGKVTLGNGTLRLMRQRELVDFAVEWIKKTENKTTGFSFQKDCAGSKHCLHIFCI